MIWSRLIGDEVFGLIEYLKVSKSHLRHKSSLLLGLVDVLILKRCKLNVQDNNVSSPSAKEIQVFQSLFGLEGYRLMEWPAYYFDSEAGILARWEAVQLKGRLVDFNKDCYRHFHAL